MRKNRQGFTPVIILICVAAVLLLVTIFKKDANTRPGSTPQTSQPQQEDAEVRFSNETGEVLLLSKCLYQSPEPCKLVTVSLDGDIKEYPSKSVFNTSYPQITSDGIHLVNANNNKLQIFNVDKKTSASIVIPQASYVQRQIYDSGFWALIGGKYEWFTYDGIVKKSFSPEMFPKQYENYFDISYGVTLSKFDGSRELLALASSNGGDGAVSTLTSYNDSSFVKVTDLFDKNKVSLIETASFPSGEPLLLISSEEGIYSLDSHNTKKMILKLPHRPFAQSITDVIASADMSKIYYKINGAYDSTQEDFDQLGLYQFDVKNSEKIRMISTPRDAKKFWKYSDYHMISISPSQQFMSLSIAVVGDQSTTYTPAILSLTDFTLKKLDQLTGTAEDRVSYIGWIKKDDLSFILSSL